MEPVANWRRTELRKRWRRCRGWLEPADALATHRGVGPCRTTGRNRSSAVGDATSGRPEQRCSEICGICMAFAPGGPNVRANLPA